MKPTTETTTTTNTKTKNKEILYAHVTPTYKAWVKKTAVKYGVSQSAIVQAALKQAKTNTAFAIK